MQKRIILGLTLIMALGGCAQEPIEREPPPHRESLIPPSQVKILPGTDVYLPRSETEEYEDPIPLPYPINTAGAEDSAFIMPDGNTLYFFFTPDVNKPVEEQVADGVTGIYVSYKANGGWGEPERVFLQDPGKLALDGCEFVQGDVMWFCTAREGIAGLHWATAEFENGEWGNWMIADFHPDYEVGELHITADGTALYFHSSRAGGKGEYDIWVSRNVDGEWQEPENVEAVNTVYSEGWPFVTQDGSELWFSTLMGAPEIYRSKWVDGEWGAPEKMFSGFAGEPSMDRDGNVYFTHHFYKDDAMLEADIYVAIRK